MAKKIPSPLDYREEHRGTFSDRRDDTKAFVLRSGGSVYVWLQGADSLRIGGQPVDESPQGAMCLELAPAMAKTLADVLRAAAEE